MHLRRSELFPSTVFVAVFILLISGHVSAATYVVDSTADTNAPDDPTITFREAIAASNASPEADTILFASSLAGQEIATSLGFSLQDEVVIDGSAASGLTVRLTADTTLISVNPGVSATIRNLRLTGSDGYAVRACSHTSLESMEITGSGSFIGFAFCGADTTLTIRSSVLSELYFFTLLTLPDGSTETLAITLETSVLESSPISLRSAGERVALTFRGSTLENPKWIRIYGGVDLTIESSAVVSAAGFVFATERMTRYWTDSRIPAEYVYPTVELLGTTISGISANGPLLHLIDSEVFIRHSTITANSAQHIIEIDSINPYDVDDPLSYTSSLSFDHAIVSNNTASEAAVEVGAGNVEASYSVLPSFTYLSPDSSESVDSFTSLYRDAAVALGPLVETSLYPPAHIPEAGSFVIDAGDPGAVAGVGGVPITEQRGSDRIVGAAIDIGAVEFNRAPVLDVVALKADYEAQFQLLREAGTPELDIVLDLDTYVSDPDGHLIDDISFTGGAGLAFDSSSHVLSGTHTVLKATPFVVAATDDTGLAGETEVRLRQGQSSSSGGGAFGIALVLLALAGRRPRSRYHANPPPI